MLKICNCSRDGSLCATKTFQNWTTFPSDPKCPQLKVSHNGIQCKTCEELNKKIHTCTCNSYFCKLRIHCSLSNNIHEKMTCFWLAGGKLILHARWLQICNRCKVVKESKLLLKFHLYRLSVMFFLCKLFKSNTWVIV